MKHLFFQLSFMCMIFSFHNNVFAKELQSILNFSCGLGSFSATGSALANAVSSTPVILDVSYHYPISYKLYAVADIEPNLTGDFLMIAGGLQYFFLAAPPQNGSGIGDTTEIRVYNLWDPYVTIEVGGTRYQTQYQTYNATTSTTQNNVTIANLWGPSFKAGTLYRIKNDLAVTSELGMNIGLASGVTLTGFTLTLGTALLF